MRMLTGQRVAEIVTELETKADTNSNPHTAEGIRFAAGLLRRACEMEPGPPATAPLRAAVLRDDRLAASLRRVYIDPLKEARDGGESAFATLRAYFAAGCNASAASAALGVNRRTVSTRLGIIEEALGCSLIECSAEIQAALMLDGAGS